MSHREFLCLKQRQEQCWRTLAIRDGLRLVSISPPLRSHPCFACLRLSVSAKLRKFDSASKLKGRYVYKTLGCRSDCNAETCRRIPRTKVGAERRYTCKFCTFVEYMWLEQNGLLVGVRNSNLSQSSRVPVLSDPYSFACFHAATSLKMMAN